MTPKLRFRPLRNEDKDFIYHSWLKNYKNSRFAKQIPHDLFYKHHTPIVHDIVEHEEVIVACNPDDIDHIYGYLVGEYVEEGACIHWIYVKGSFKRFGIATALIEKLLDIDKFRDPMKDEEFVIFYSHRTKNAAYITNKIAMLYNPYYWIGREPYEA